MKLAVCFTNFGPYHLARLRALAEELERGGRQLLAVEVAGAERRYPWLASNREEPFQRVHQVIIGPGADADSPGKFDGPDDPGE